MFVSSGLSAVPVTQGSGGCVNKDCLSKRKEVGKARKVVTSVQAAPRPEAGEPENPSAGSLCGLHSEVRFSDFIPLFKLVENF